MNPLNTGKVRKRWAWILCIQLLVLACQPSGYQLLLDKTWDAHLKSRLEDFGRNGVEAPWPADFDKNQLVEAALHYQGTPYRSGGITRKGMDCSGLLYRAAKDIGVNLPHRSSDIARYGQIVPTRGRLRRGDLVFFTGDGRQLITHSGIMISSDQFIHVSSSKGCVITDLETDYWVTHFLFGTR